MSVGQIKMGLQSLITDVCRQKRLQGQELEMIQALGQSLLSTLPPEDTFLSIDMRSNVIALGLRAFEDTVVTAQQMGLATDTREIDDLLKRTKQSVGLHDVHEVINDEDFQDTDRVTNWLTTLAAKKPSNPSLSFNLGASKGFLFTVRDVNNLVRGYLFGTMHYLITKEMRDCAKLTPEVQEKLSQSILLGTEISMPEKSDLDSVENSLFEIAERAGIFQVGIDSMNREELDPVKKTVTPFSTEDALSEFKNAAVAYQQGDINKQLALGLKNDPNTIKRNQDMTQRINSLFHAQTPLMDKHGQFPTLFFGVGTQHLISSDVNNTIVGMLRQHNWTVELETN